jgi:hypothetical protein
LDGFRRNDVGVAAYVALSAKPLSWNSPQTGALGVGGWNSDHLRKAG